MFKVKDSLLLLTLVLILLPILLFPLSSDHVIFILAGKTISEGGKLYVDFIDLKSPPIYMLFSILYRFFGFEEVSYRLFDLVWQLFTALSIYFVNFSILKKKNIAVLSSIIYSLLYSTLNFSQTLQIETLMILPLVWAVYFFITQRNYKYLILTGFLLGIISGAKLTLAILIPGFILYLFLNKDMKKIQNSVMILIGSLSGFLISMFPLFDNEIWGSYLYVMEYLIRYIGFSQMDGGLLAYIFKMTGNYFGDFFSLLLLLSLFIAIFNHFHQPWKSYKKVNFASLLLLLIVLLLSTVFIESKLTPYHFSRIYFPVSVFASSGLIYLFNSLKPKFKYLNGMNKILLILLISSFIVFSPLPRWVNIAINGASTYNNNELYDRLYTRKGKVELNRISQKKVSNFIKINSKHNDKITLMAIGSNQIYLYCGLKKFSMFGQSQYYLAQSIPKKWEENILKELNQSDCLVIQTNDNHSNIRGTDLSSWEISQKNNLIRMSINKHFQFVRSIDEYRIYKKR